jgi:hypothetical protein
MRMLHIHIVSRVGNGENGSVRDEGQHDGIGNRHEWPVLGAKLENAAETIQHRPYRCRLVGSQLGAVGISWSIYLRNFAAAVDRDELHCFHPIVARTTPRVGFPTNFRILPPRHGAFRSL